MSAPDLLATLSGLCPDLAPSALQTLLLWECVWCAEADCVSLKPTFHSCQAAHPNCLAPSSQLLSSFLLPTPHHTVADPPQTGSPTLKHSVGALLVPMSIDPSPLLVSFSSQTSPGTVTFTLVCSQSSVQHGSLWNLLEIKTCPDRGNHRGLDTRGNARKASVRGQHSHFPVHTGFQCLGKTGWPTLAHSPGAGQVASWRCSRL